jgi:hypothetical protein
MAELFLSNSGKYCLAQYFREQEPYQGLLLPAATSAIRKKSILFTEALSHGERYQIEY